MYTQNNGLLLWGNTGNGKTYAAACIANALIARGIPALITSFPRILNAGWDKREIAEQMRQYPLLVIDDLGAERESDYFNNLVINGTLITDTMPGKPAWYKTADMASIFVGEHVSGITFSK